MKRIIIWVFYFALIGASCEKESDKCEEHNLPECDNYDPCLDKTQVTASFTANEQVIFYDYVEEEATTLFLPESDTLHQLSEVHFRAIQEEYDSLKWFIGSEVIENQREVVKTSFPVGLTFDISLVVWKKDTLCFPNTIADTVTKTFHATKYPKYYDSAYRVSFENSTETRIIGFGEERAFNLLEENCNLSAYSLTRGIGYGYKTFVLSGTSNFPKNSNCMSVNGSFFFPKDSIYATIAYSDPENGYIETKLSGVRVE